MLVLLLTSIKLCAYNKAMAYNWKENCRNIEEHIASCNGDLSDFLKWSTVVATMFVGAAAYLHKAIDELKEVYTKENLIVLTEDPKIGNPDLLPGTKSSGNYILQLYHLHKFMKMSKIDIKELNSIFEFGAGYGCNAVILKRLNFDGEYIILDIPPVTELQKYYISKTDSLTLTEWYDSEKHYEPDLVLAICSLSETDDNTIIKFINDISAHYIFILTHQSILPIIEKQLKRNNYNIKVENSLLETNYYVLATKRHYDRL